MADQPNSMTVTLAHPLKEADAASVYAVQVRDYGPGEEITVPTVQVMRLVNAGLVKGVAPEDGKAIRDLFTRAANKAADPKPGPASAGGGDGDAADGGVVKKTSARK